MFLTLLRLIKLIVLVVLTGGLTSFAGIGPLLSERVFGSTSFPEKDYTVMAGREEVVRGIPAGFDILQKAQKNIQHDLGLPETPSSSPSGGIPGSATPVPATHPYIAGFLLCMALAGLFALFVLLYRETRKNRKDSLLETSFLKSQEPASSGEDADFPNVDFLVSRKDSTEFPSNDLPGDLEKAGKDLAEKLDGIFSFVRKGLGQLQEDVRLALYHDDDANSFPVFLSGSAGKRYPDFYVPPQLSSYSRETRFVWSKDETMTGSFLDGTRVETVSLPFYDGMGSRFILFISLASEKEIPEKWKTAGRNLAKNLRPLLEDYARIHYSPVTSTRTKNGDPDARAIENRMIEEMEKGKRLETRLSLLFIRIVTTRPSGDMTDVNSFYRLFRDRLGTALRSSDMMHSDDRGSYTVLLPETLRSEAHAVLNRIMDLFEEQYQRYGRIGLRFLSDLREIRPDADEHPETLLGRIRRLEVPAETLEPQEFT